jgi:hypothetical protein
MGRRAEPLRFVCRACGTERETWNTGNKGIYCDKACRADHERKGRAAPSRYRQNGYWMLRWNVGGKYVYQFEHRSVWEQANGPVPDGHEIHHVNGDKGDNRLENLQLMRGFDHRQHHLRKYHSRDEELAARREQARAYRARRKMAG